MWGSFISDAQQHCSYATDWPQSLLRCWSKKYQLSGWLQQRTTNSKYTKKTLSHALIVTFATWPTTNCFTVKDSSSSPHTAVQGDAVALPWPAIKCCLQQPPLPFYMPRLWLTQIMSKVINDDSTLSVLLWCASVFLYNSFFIWFLLLDGIWLKFGSKLIGLAWGRIISSNMWF